MVHTKTENMTSPEFRWEQQNSSSWRGSVNNISYWVILSLDGKQFILQVPGIFTGVNGMEVRTFSSFEEARKEAERSYFN